MDNMQVSSPSQNKDSTTADANSSDEESNTQQDHDDVIRERKKKKLKHYLIPKRLKKKKDDKKNKKKKKKKTKKRDGDDEDDDESEKSEKRKKAKKKKSSKRNLGEESPHRHHRPTSSSSLLAADDLSPLPTEPSGSPVSSMTSKRSVRIAAGDLDAIPEDEAAVIKKPKSSRTKVKKHSSSSGKKKHHSTKSALLTKGDSMRTKKTKTVRRVKDSSNHNKESNNEIRSRHVLKREMRRTIRKLILLNIFFEETAAKALQAENNIDRKSFIGSGHSRELHFLFEEEESLDDDDEGEDHVEKGDVRMVPPDTKKARPKRSSIRMPDDGNRKEDLAATASGKKGVQWEKELFRVKLMPYYEQSVKRICFYTDEEIKKFRFEKFMEEHADEFEEVDSDEAEDDDSDYEWVEEVIEEDDPSYYSTGTDDDDEDDEDGDDDDDDDAGYHYEDDMLSA